MAKVFVQVVGGQPKEVEGMGTVADCRRHLALGAEYQGSIGGRPATDHESLNDYQVVTFAPKVKGAN